MPRLGHTWAGIGFRRDASRSERSEAPRNDTLTSKEQDTRHLAWGVFDAAIADMGSEMSPLFKGCYRGSAAARIDEGIPGTRTR